MSSDVEPRALVHPEVLAASAAQLERVNAQLGEVGSELAGLAASGVLDLATAQHCRSVCSAVESSRIHAGGLADDLRRAADRGESLLRELVRAVVRAGNELANATPDRRDQAGGASADRPAHPDAPVGWTPPVARAGSGPALGGTDGQRPGTSLGVQVAQLPDG